MPKEKVERKIRRPLIGYDPFLPTEGHGRDEMMQIYLWSMDEVFEAQEEWEKYSPASRELGPFVRWTGAMKLCGLYRAYQDGDKKAILEALAICCFYSLPIPRWLERACLAAYRKVQNYKVKSWEDVFGRPHPKGTHILTKRQEIEYSRKVYERIQQIKKNKPSTPIDGALFERIGKEFGIGGKTLTEGYYYKGKDWPTEIWDLFNKFTT